ncbi:MAG: DUF2442 domain-containing protein [Deltaproteobacteria bacterium]|nr:DUF2442 domain-containing protein [Deltaproteobacteria bacterium]
MLSTGVLLADAIAAFEREYYDVANAYRAAKTRWLTESRNVAGCLQSAAIHLPAFTLLGTMPFLAEVEQVHEGRDEEAKINEIEHLTKPSATRYVPAFAPLREPGFFYRAHAAHGTVAWNHDVDLSPETVWAETVRSAA